jgi:sodium transport system ATP-binding protein
METGNKTYPPIRLEGLTKIFRDGPKGDVRALDGVSFECRAGEVFGLIGPNGAGKTTCLRVLSTLLVPTSGAATVGGFDVVQEADEVRKRIGYVTGSAGIYDRMTAHEIVEYFGRLNGMPEDALQRRIDELFDILDMQEYRDFYGGRLSSGTKQKVSIARCIVHDPPILIFDEPTVGLDVMVARSVITLIKRLADEGKCILYSTHIMSEAEFLCREIAIIHNGQLLLSGGLKEIKAHNPGKRLDEIFFDTIQGARNEPEADSDNL